MGLIRGLRFRAFCVAVTALAVGLAVVASSAAAPPTPPAVKQKEAEARQILAQVNALDNQSDRTVEAWDGAKYELSQIKKQEAHNKVLLRWARHGYRIAEQRAEARLVALYESENPSAIDAIFGATNLNDILDRLETIHATTALDRRLVKQVESKREVLAQREIAIENARVRQAQAVLELTQRKAQIEAQLAKRQRLLASVQGEVQQLKAQEAARQAKLIAEAKARLAAAQAAAVARAKAAAKARARAEAQARAQAAAAAAAAARAKAKAAATTTTASTTTSSTTTTTTASTTTDPTTTVPTTTTNPNDLPPSVNLVTAPGHPQAATIAMQYLGVPYVWGGASPSTGFDCSGLVMYVYAQLGIPLPHFAAAQYGMGVPVPRNQLQPGDLVFFDNLNHVGISLGGNLFIDAPHTGDVVKISTITGWYTQNYVGARRI
jgi:cell wall-associated NlpC family hydrolase